MFCQVTPFLSNLCGSSTITKGLVEAKASKGTENLSLIKRLPSLPLSFPAIVSELIIPALINKTWIFCLSSVPTKRTISEGIKAFFALFFWLSTTYNSISVSPYCLAKSLRKCSASDALCKKFFVPALMERVGTTTINLNTPSTRLSSNIVLV